MNQIIQSERRIEQCGLFFYPIIEKYVIAEVSCTIVIQDIENAVRSINWPSYVTNFTSLENPYYFAFKAIINVLGQHQMKLGITEPVNFIFDEQTEKKNTLGAWSLLRDSTTGIAQELMGDMPIYINDEHEPALQAADLLAWWIRKWEMEGISWKDAKPFPWRINKEIPGLAMNFSEEDLRTELSRGLDDPKVLFRASRQN